MVGCDHCLNFILVYVLSVPKARLILVESQVYVSFIFADGFLECKVAKVANITGVEGCDHCQKYIFVYVLKVAKVAYVAELVGVKGVVPCLFYDGRGILGR